MQKHDFSKIAKLVKNYTKKIVLAIFKFGSKLVKRYPKITFSLFSKLPKNYTKITHKIQIAPLRGAVGIENVIFDHNGYPYHGKVKSFADGAREGGLKF